MPISREVTLTASAVETVTLPVNAITVEVMTNGAGTLDFVVDPDAPNPTIGGDDTWKLPASASSRVVSDPSQANTEVRLISDANTVVFITVLE